MSFWLSLAFGLIGQVDFSLLSPYIFPIALLHDVRDSAVLENTEILSAYAQLKRDGKIRFAGFSTHSAGVTLPKALDMNSYDVVLFIYNHLEGPSLEPLIEKVRTKGIGTIAMKVLAGNKQGNLKGLVNERLKYSQAALRWVMANPYIDSCIITMNTFSHVEEYISASGKALDRSDVGTLSKYQNEAKNLYCRVSCADCLSSCPRGVAINDVLRYAMYYEDYRMESSALELYAGLELEKKPSYCGACPAPCRDACPYGLQVKERMLHSHRLLMA